MFGVGVDRGGHDTEEDADRTAEGAEGDRFGEELGADVGLGGAERAAAGAVGVSGGL